MMNRIPKKFPHLQGLDVTILIPFWHNFTPIELCNYCVGGISRILDLHFIMSHHSFTNIHATCGPIEQDYNNAESHAGRNGAYKG